MAKKVKIKVKPNKAKIKMRSSDGDAFPLDEARLHHLLGSSVYAALAAGEESERRESLVSGEKAPEKLTSGQDPE